MSGGTYTRTINGNHAIPIDEVLREVEDVDVGDAITFWVEATHDRGDDGSTS